MQCRAIAGAPEPSRWRKKKAPDHSAFLREVNAATGAGLTGSGSPVRRYVLVVGGDIGRHLPAESAGRCHPVQFERGRHAVKVPGEFLATRDELDHLAVLYVDPLGFGVDDDGALCGRELRGVTD